MSKLTPKTQYEIVASALNSRGDREKRILTHLATHHQLDPKAQGMMAKYTEHPEVHQALLDKQKNLSPMSLYHITLNSDMRAKSRAKIQEKIFNHPAIDGDILHELSDNPRFHSRIIDHPMAKPTTLMRIANIGGDEMRQKLMDAGHHDDPYVRHNLINFGNESIHNQLLDKRADHKPTVQAIRMNFNATHAVKRRAETLLSQMK